jgi:hypothetical protein
VCPEGWPYELAAARVGDGGLHWGVLTELESLAVMVAPGEMGLGRPTEDIPAVAAMPTPGWASDEVLAEMVARHVLSPAVLAAPTPGRAFEEVFGDLFGLQFLKGAFAVWAGGCWGRPRGYWILTGCSRRRLGLRSAGWGDHA